MIFRAILFLPGKSLSIIPAKIVNNPCPGIPGTDSNIPIITRIPPIRFFEIETIILKNQFLLCLPCFDSVK